MTLPPGQEEKVADLQAVLRETNSWIMAPTLGEAKRRAELLRELIRANPEGARR